MPVASLGRNLARSGQRAKEMASDRLRDPDRPRRDPGGFLGEGPEIDPTAPRGFLDGIIQDALAGPPQGGQRPGGQRQGPESREPRRPTLRPEEESPPALLPGNPDDLGARGRRRRREDDDTPSPVLRRGLLGV